MHKSGGERSPKRDARRLKKSSSLGRSEKLLWAMTALTAAIVLLALMRPGREQTVVRSPSVSRAAAPQAQVTTAVVVEESAPVPRRPQTWKVLFSSPAAGTTDVSRRTDIRLFLNGPVDRAVVEWAFTLSPATPGTFDWPRPDQLVFTPAASLAPGTRYTLSLTPTQGVYAGQEYELLETRWAFTTGTARTYHTDIQPLVAAYCDSCHGAAGAAHEIPLESYTDVRRYITPGAASESAFYTFIQARKHHINMAGPTHSTSQKLAVIKDWINEDGAAQ